MFPLFIDAFIASGDAFLPWFILVFARLSPLFIITPFFGHRAISFGIRFSFAVALSLLFALALYPASTPPLTPTFFLRLALKELTVGLAMAFFASTLLWVTWLAGGIADKLRGLPDNSTAQSPLSRLSLLLSTALFLTAGGHLLVIRAFARSFERLSPFSLSTPQPQLLASTISLISEFFLLTAAIVLPIAFCLFVADLLLLLLEQTAPLFSSALNDRSLRSLFGLLLFVVALRFGLDVVNNGALEIAEALNRLMGTLQ